MLIDQELHRARVGVVDRLREFDGGVANSFAERRREQRRRAFLNHLLIAPLDRAIAFAEMNDVAVLIGHDLKLNVMRVNDQLLDVNRGVPESLLRFRSRAVKALHEDWRSLCAARIPRPPPPETALIMTRITDLFRDVDRLGFRLDDPVAARRNGDTGFAGRRPRGILVAHRAHRRRRRTDELDFAALADLGEMRVLGQKSVARMDRIDIADFGRAHDAIDFQIAIRARRRSRCRSTSSASCTWSESTSASE